MEAGNPFHSLTSKICQQGDATVIRQQPFQRTMGSGCQRALENSALLAECQAVPWVGVTRLLFPKVPTPVWMSWSGPAEAPLPALTLTDSSRGLDAH